MILVCFRFKTIGIFITNVRNQGSGPIHERMIFVFCYHLSTLINCEKRLLVRDV